MNEHELKQALADRGITQRHIAKKIEVSYSILCLWLNGSETMPKEREKQIKELLEIE